MTFKFNVTFKRGPVVVAVVRGERAVDSDEILLVEAQQVIEVEQVLEKLTGLRVHIEQVN